MKKAIQTFSTIVTAVTFLCIVIAAIFILPKAAGFTPYIVESGSMEPFKQSAGLRLCLCNIMIITFQGCQLTYRSNSGKIRLFFLFSASGQTAYAYGQRQKYSCCPISSHSSPPFFCHFEACHTRE